MSRLLVLVLAILAVYSPSAMAQGQAIDPKTLEAVRPTGQVTGFDRVGTTSSAAQTPFGKIPQAEVRYEESGGEVSYILTVTISDLAESLTRAMSIADITGAPRLQVGDHEGDWTFVMVAGKYRGKERYGAGDGAKAGDVQFMVNSRFMVLVSATGGITDVKQLYALIATMKLDQPQGFM